LRAARVSTAVRNARPFASIDLPAKQPADGGEYERFHRTKQVDVARSGTVSGRAGLSDQINHQRGKSQQRRDRDAYRSDAIDAFYCAALVSLLVRLPGFVT